MRTYIIATLESDYSCKSAINVRTKFKKYINNVDIFWGVDRYNSLKILNEYGLSVVDNNITKFSYYEEVLGCFLSHYKLWNKCIELDEPIVILEHDVVIKGDPIKYFNKLDTNSNSLLNLGKPLWSDDTFEHLGGAHSYLVNPKVSKVLIDRANNYGISPTDIFINRELVDIIDVKPFLFEQISRFSLIQNEENFGKWGTGIEDKNNLICGEKAWNNSEKSRHFKRKNK